MESPKLIDVSSIAELADYDINDIVVAIGVFDGIHLGHQKLLRELTELSEKLSAVPVAMTFHPHPRELLHPRTVPPLLIPPQERIVMLHQFGAKAVVTIPFTKQFAALSPTEFLDSCLSAENVRLSGVCVGSEWRFGAKGMGNSQLLAEEAAKRGFVSSAVDELVVDGTTVSSTAVRSAILHGELQKAARMLGRRYTLFGMIRSGYGVAGGKLNHPTANLEISYGIVPPNGVYAGFAVIDGKKHPAVTNIGVSPTFKDVYKEEKVRVEVHILDFEKDIYDRQIGFEFVSFIREERCFPDHEALKAQILSDIAQVIEILNREI